MFYPFCIEREREYQKKKKSEGVDEPLSSEGEFTISTEAKMKKRNPSKSGV